MAFVPDFKGPLCDDDHDDVARHDNRQSELRQFKTTRRGLGGCMISKQLSIYFGNRSAGK